MQAVSIGHVLEGMKQRQNIKFFAPADQVFLHPPEDLSRCISLSDSHGLFGLLKAIGIKACLKSQLQEGPAAAANVQQTTSFYPNP